MRDYSISETEDAPSLASDRFADRYRLVRKVGHGSSKIVWLAHDEVLDREVALAFVPAATLEPGAFEREARLTAKLGVHPNVVAIHDIGRSAATLFFVTPYLAGGSLDERLARVKNGRLQIAEALRIAAEVASGLAHAHALGIVHRDVKPSNIWLTEDGRAALGDFGIARTFNQGSPAPGLLVGTALYVSPEQAVGDVVDARSDLYSLGVTLFEMVCGERPFTGSNAAEIIERHLHEPPPAPSRLNAAVPLALERLILRLLSKRPAERPESAESVRDALEVMHKLPSRNAPDAGNLVGRRDELARGREALDAFLAGHGRLVAVTGEPGIGKSRLARELAGEAEERAAAVLAFACPEEHGAPAYWPWRHLLRALPTAVRRMPSLPPEVAELLPGHELTSEREEDPDPEAARFRTFEAITGVLERAAARRALVLVVEDLQWADALSVRLLCHVARRASAMRVLLLVTYRDPVGPDDPLAEIAGVLATDAAHIRLALRGLAKPEIGQFIERTAGLRSARLAEALADHTGGNPFFVAEVVRMLQSKGAVEDADLSATLPASVEEVIGHRLDRLSTDVRRTLHAAAVQGTEFELDVLAATAELPRMAVYDALETARATHLIEPASSRTWRFVHAILRDAVAARMTVSRRARLHAAVGRELERRTRGVEELARHFVAAAELGDDEAARAVRYSQLAAEAASRLHAYEQAADHYRRALDALELRLQPSHGERVTLLLALADAVTEQGKAADGREIYERAAAEARLHDSPDAFAEAAIGFSNWQEYGAAERAIELLSETLERLPPGDSQLRANVLGHLAARLPANCQGERERLIGDAIAMARRLGDPACLAVLLTRGAFVHSGADQREIRAALAEESLALATATRPGVGTLWAHVVRLLDALALGRMDEVHSERSEYNARAEGLKRPFFVWQRMVIDATLSAFAGRLDEAERTAEDAFALIGRLEEDSNQEHTVQLLMFARLRGLPERAPAAELREYAERYQTLPLWLALLAALEADLGRVSAARRALNAAMGTGPRGLAPDEDWLSRLVLLADACVAVGDTRHAERLHDLLAPHADISVITERGWAVWGAAARPLGRLAALCGDVDQARTWFERALELHRAWEAEPFVAHTIADYAVAVPHGPGAQRLAEALEISARLGLAGLEPRLRSLLEAYSG